VGIGLDGAILESVELVFGDNVLCCEGCGVVRTSVIDDSPLCDEPLSPRSLIRLHFGVDSLAGCVLALLPDMINKVSIRKKRDYNQHN